MNKAEYTKMKIKEKLLEFMKSKSIDQIKVIDITTSLNINRGTFYLYYDSIYEPLQEIEDSFFDGFRRINKDFINYPLDDKYYYFPHPKIVETLEYLRLHSEISKVLYGPYGEVSFQNRCSKLVSEFFYGKAVSEHLLSDDNLIESFLIGGLRELTVSWINSGMQLDNERFSIMIYRLMFGFFKPPCDEFKIDEYVSLPTAPNSLNMEQMSSDDIHTRLKHGFDDIENGNVQDAAKAFAKFKEIR